MDMVLLSELVGIILGDGNLHKKSNCITITGSLEDYFYYKNYVVVLFERLFGLTPKLRKRNDRNSYYLQLENKFVFNKLLSFDLRRGDKTKNAVVPTFIFENSFFIKSFLRGLFDTDGCLKFSKQSKEINYYPRIRIALKDSVFSRDLKILFESLDFNFSMYLSNNNLVYEVSGAKNLEKWMFEIGSKNPVHHTKYLFWKKFGFYVSKSSLSSRLKALNLKKAL